MQRIIFPCGINIKILIISPCPSRPTCNTSTPHQRVAPHGLRTTALMRVFVVYAISHAACSKYATSHTSFPLFFFSTEGKEKRGEEEREGRRQRGETQQRKGTRDIQNGFLMTVITVICYSWCQNSGGRNAAAKYYLLQHVINPQAAVNSLPRRCTAEEAAHYLTILKPNFGRLAISNLNFPAWLITRFPLKLKRGQQRNVHITVRYRRSH